MTFQGEKRLLAIVKWFSVGSWLRISVANSDLCDGQDLKKQYLGTAALRLVLFFEIAS